MILASQFVKVIGRQFFMSLMSLPSFGSNVITDSLCDGVRLPVATLYSQDSLRILPIWGPKGFIHYVRNTVWAWRCVLTRF